MVQYVLRANDGAGHYLMSFGMTVSGGEVHLTYDPFQALHFGSWEEAAAIAAFVVYFLDEDFAGEFEIAESIM